MQLRKLTQRRIHRLTHLIYKNFKSEHLLNGTAHPDSVKAAIRRALLQAKEEEQ